MAILRRILLSLFGLLVLSQWVLGMYFLSHAPRAADPARGVIYPVNIHGGVFYLTREESLYYNNNNIDVGFYLFAPVFIYELLAQIKRSKQKEQYGSATE